MAYSSKTEVHWFINKDQHLWLDFLHHIRNDPRNDKLDLIALYTMWKQQTKSKFILLLSYRLGVHLPSGFLGGRIELKRDAVNTVSLVGRRLKPLPFEYVPQVSSTSSTCDLCPPPIRVRLMFNKKKTFVNTGDCRRGQRAKIIPYPYVQERNSAYRLPYGPRKSFIECRPATPWVELCRWFV